MYNLYSVYNLHGYNINSCYYSDLVRCTSDFGMVNRSSLQRNTFFLKKWLTVLHFHSIKNIFYLNTVAHVSGLKLFSTCKVTSISGFTSADFAVTHSFIQWLKVLVVHRMYNGSHISQRSSFYSGPHLI